MKKWFAWLAAAVCALSLLTACGAQTDSTPAGSEGSPSETGVSGTTAGSTEKAAAEGSSYSIALCLTGSADEPGWNTLAYDGLKQLGETYGCKISLSDRLTSDTLPDAVERYAADGNQIIIGLGQEFADAALKIGKKHSGTDFICIQAHTSSSNVASYNIRTEEPAYLTGLLASGLSISNVVGFIGPYNEEPYTKMARAFENGAKESNPDVTFQAVWLDSDSNTGAAREAVNDMIASDADIIGQCAGRNSDGVLDAVYSGGAMSFGDVYDQSLKYPRTVVTSAVYDITGLVTLAAEDVMNGSFKGEVRDFGLAEGMIEMTPYGEMGSRVPKKLKTLVEEKIESIKAGTFTVPCGEGQK